MRLFLTICCFTLHLSGGQLSAAEKIEWEVVQPFRFLRFESDHKLQELAFQAARKSSGDLDFRSRPVSAMEAKLNDPQWWEKQIEELGKSPKEIVETLRRSEGRTPELVDYRLGWGALLRSRENGAIYEGTCWSAATQSFYGCRSNPGDIRGKDQYMFPEHHIVRARLVTQQPNADGTVFQGHCSFAVSGVMRDRGPNRSGERGRYGILEGNATARSRELAERELDDCSDGILLRIKYGERYELSASAAGVAVPPATIEVADHVVVGIGDSYASGEGNPDLPALLDETRAVRPLTEETGNGKPDFGVPRRKGRADGSIAPYTSARWLDRRCHRSIYSAQTRAAVALALAGNRHHAITYVSFACSGAEITEGLFWPQDGRECTRNLGSGQRYLQPQISAVVGALGERLNPAQARRSRYRHFGTPLPITDKYYQSHLRYGDNATRRRINSACRSWPGNHRMRRQPYLRLANFERKIDVLLLSIGGNDVGFSSLVASTVLNPRIGDIPIIGDPVSSIFRAAAGGISIRQARRHMGGLDHRFGLLSAAIRDKLEISDNNKVVMTLYPTPLFDHDNRLCAAGRKGMNVSSLMRLRNNQPGESPIDPSDAQSFVDELNGKLKNLAVDKGWKVVDSHLEHYKRHGICAESPASAPVKTAAIFDIPRKKIGDDWERVDGHRFDPSRDFYPYASRGRWFRTFNDAFLAAQYFKTNAYEVKDSFDRKSPFYFAFRAMGGPFHPTAEGLAATADGLYCAAASILFRDQPDASCE